MQIIGETIHHGDFFSQIATGAPDDADARAILTTFGQMSAYPFTFTPETNKYDAAALEEFERTGKCQIGWATYERLGN